ncbi:MAG: META domain-containing protein [bacterium]
MWAGGCTSPTLPPPTLAGTSWQLLAIQSMDDRQGTLTEADPSRYTHSFGRDGSAVMRLDCNRASAPWKLTPGPEASSGSLTFGPVAATRARCPPPSIDARVLRDLPDVRSFLLRDGRLHLSLMADGGIYSWGPVTNP